MWIKSIHNDYVMLSHISCFRVVAVMPSEYRDPYTTPDIKPTHYAVIAYLSSKHEIPQMAYKIQTASDRIELYTGTKQECQDYIVEKLGVQVFWKVLGYITAGAVGAILTYFLTSLNS